jgi:hypothetical protein
MATPRAMSIPSRLSVSTIKEEALLISDFYSFQEAKRDRQMD